LAYSLCFLQITAWGKNWRKTMLELIGLFLALGLIMRTARRRGGEKWLWLAVGLFGYMVIAFAFSVFFRPIAAIYPLVGLGWLALTLLGSYFLTGGTRSLGMTWQCDACLSFNDPSTLVCACGAAVEDHAKQMPGEQQQAEPH
jgi:hypothetical protein